MENFLKIREIKMLQITVDFFLKIREIKIIFNLGPNSGMELLELLDELLVDRILGRSGTLGTKSCEISTSEFGSVSASDEDSS